MSSKFRSRLKTILKFGFLTTHVIPITAVWYIDRNRFYETQKLAEKPLIKRTYPFYFDRPSVDDELLEIVEDESKDVSPVIVVSGRPKVGKTSCVNELQRALVTNSIEDGSEETEGESSDNDVFPEYITFRINLDPKMMNHLIHRYMDERDYYYQKLDDEWIHMQLMSRVIAENIGYQIDRSYLTIGNVIRMHPLMPIMVFFDPLLIKMNHSFGYLNTIDHLIQFIRKYGNNDNPRLSKQKRFVLFIDDSCCLTEVQTQVLIEMLRPLLKTRIIKVVFVTSDHRWIRKLQSFLKVEHFDIQPLTPEETLEFVSDRRFLSYISRYTHLPRNKKGGNGDSEENTTKNNNDSSGESRIFSRVDLNIGIPQFIIQSAMSNSYNKQGDQRDRWSMIKQETLRNKAKQCLTNNAGMLCRKAIRKIQESENQSISYSEFCQTIDNQSKVLQFLEELNGFMDEPIFHHSFDDDRVSVCYSYTIPALMDGDPSKPRKDPKSKSK